MHSYFRGWYFKIQGECDSLAFIPALHIDRRGKRTASVQIITDEKAYWIDYPSDAFWYEKRDLFITAGNCAFSEAGVYIDINSDEITASGILEFVKLSPIRYDIMGPFRFVPFLECRHSVFSMSHSVSGQLSLNGRKIEFANGTGYIEGDRGRSFPKRYAWTQCCHSDDFPCSLMLSVADIQLPGKILKGIIGVLIWEGREYRIATYLGAKAAHIGNGHMAVTQGEYTLEAELLDHRSMRLRAPVSGEMTRLIRENPSCHAHYRFIIGETVQFDLETDRASFEYEYD